MKQLSTVLFSACSLLLVSSYSAQAQFVPNPNHVYAIINRANNQALEIGGGGDQTQSGRTANTWGYWGGAHQQWMFRDMSAVAPGYYEIVNRTSRLSLTTLNPAFGYPSSPPNGANVTQETGGQTGRNSTKSQLWTVKGSGSFSIALYNTATTSPVNPQLLAINDRNQAIQDRELRYGSTSPIYSVAGGDKWDIVDVSTNPLEAYTAGTFQIVNRNSGKALAVNLDDEFARNIYQMPASRFSGEEWTFVPSTTTAGYYYVINRRNRLVLDINDASKDNGAPLNVWENNQNAWQEWAFLDIKDSHVLTLSEFTDGRVVKIYSRHAGKVVQVSGSGSTADRAGIDMWNDLALPWQQWTVQFSSYNRLSAPITAVPASSPTTAVPASSTTVVSTLTNSEVNLYPNPVHDKLSIIVGPSLDLSSSTISLTDVHGRRMSIHHKLGQVDVSSLATGLYFLTISSGEQTIRQKFIKK
jgi:hypothetical protein